MHHDSPAGPWFNIKMSSYQYRKSHCGDKTVVRSSYLHNGISYTGKMTSLYWFIPLDITFFRVQIARFMSCQTRGGRTSKPDVCFWFWCMDVHTKLGKRYGNYIYQFYRLLVDKQSPFSCYLSRWLQAYYDIYVCNFHLDFVVVETLSNT